MKKPRLYADALGPRQARWFYLNVTTTISRVRRAKTSQVIELFDGIGRSYQATIKSISKRETIAQILSITEHKDQRLPVTLGLALIKVRSFRLGAPKSNGTRRTCDSTTNYTIH